MKGWHKAAIAVLIVSLLLAVLSPLLPRPVRADPGPDWWDYNWDYRMKLTFDNSGQTENLTDFTVLIKLTPANFNYAHCESAGEDIRFVDADDSTALSYHFEQWTYNGTSWIWVEVPQIDGGSSTDYIWLYYGNSTATDAQDQTGTYDANFVAVWHLNDTGGATPTQYDSTSYNNDGTPVNTESGDFGVSGNINGAMDFDGTDDYVNITGVEADINVTAGTFEVRMKMASSLVSNGQMHGILEIGNTSNDDNLIGIIKSGQDNLQMRYKESDVDYNAQILNISGFANTWKYIVGVWTATHVLIYEDGVFKHAEDRSASPDITPSMLNQSTLGADGVETPDHFFDGMLDEVRVSNIARSLDWIKAQHLSMSDTFIPYDQVEQRVIAIDCGGWAWCTHKPAEIFDVTLQGWLLEGERAHAPNTTALHMVGTMNMTGTTNESHTLDLYGNGVRSVFYARQEAPGISATLGGFLQDKGNDTYYIANTGMLALPNPEGTILKTFRLCFFWVETPELNVTVSTERGNWAEIGEVVVTAYAKFMQDLVDNLIGTGARQWIAGTMSRISDIMATLRSSLNVPYIP